MANPLKVLKPAERQIVIMILTMLDGKSVGTVCDILDVVNYFLNSATIFDSDDRIFSVDEIRDKIKAV